MLIGISIRITSAIGIPRSPIRNKKDCLYLMARESITRRGREVQFSSGCAYVIEFAGAEAPAGSFG